MISYTQMLSVAEYGSNSSSINKDEEALIIAIYTHADKIEELFKKIPQKNIEFLWFAISINNLDAVRALLKEPILRSSLTEKNNLALLLAAKHGNTQIIEELLSDQAVLIRFNENSEEILRVANENDQYEAMQKLLKHRSTKKTLYTNFSQIAEEPSKFELNYQGESYKLSSLDEFMLCNVLLGLVSSYDDENIAQMFKQFYSFKNTQQKKDKLLLMRFYHPDKLSINTTLKEIYTAVSERPRIKTTLDTEAAEKDSSNIKVIADHISQLIQQEHKSIFPTMERTQNTEVQKFFTALQENINKAQMMVENSQNTKKPLTFLDAYKTLTKEDKKSGFSKMIGKIKTKVFKDPHKEKAKDWLDDLKDKAKNQTRENPSKEQAHKAEILERRNKIKRRQAKELAEQKRIEREAREKEIAEMRQRQQLEEATRREQRRQQKEMAEKSQREQIEEASRKEQTRQQKEQERKQNAQKYKEKAEPERKNSEEEREKAPRTGISFFAFVKKYIQIVLAKFASFFKKIKTFLFSSKPADITVVSNTKSAGTKQSEYDSQLNKINCTDEELKACIIRNFKARKQLITDKLKLAKETNNQAERDSANDLLEALEYDVQNFIDAESTTDTVKKAQAYFKKRAAFLPRLSIVAKDENTELHNLQEVLNKKYAPKI